MRRPKDPDSKDAATNEHELPGGRARKRLEQFNRARGLPTETRDQNAKEEETAKVPQKHPPTTRRTPS